jgi:hypothetical protein
VADDRSAVVAQSAEEVSASGSITSSHVAELPVMPWIRTITGPQPARR